MVGVGPASLAVWREVQGDFVGASISTAWSGDWVASIPIMYWRVNMYPGKGGSGVDDPHHGVNEYAESY